MYTNTHKTHTHTHTHTQQTHSHTTYTLIQMLFKCYLSEIYLSSDKSDITNNFDYLGNTEVYRSIVNYNINILPNKFAISLFDRIDIHIGYRT